MPAFISFPRIQKAQSSRTQPLSNSVYDYCKFTNVLRKIVTCKWRPAAGEGQDGQGGGWAPAVGTGGHSSPVMEQGRVCTWYPLEMNWGEISYARHPGWKLQTLSWSTKTQGSHQHRRHSDVPNSLPPQESSPLTKWVWNEIMASSSRWFYHLLGKSHPCLRGWRAHSPVETILNGDGNGRFHLSLATAAMAPLVCREVHAEHSLRAAVCHGRRKGQKN